MSKVIIGMNNQISFTSKINFVDYSKFSTKIKNAYEIGYRHDVPNIMKAPEFSTLGIRTCTGGGLIKSYREAEGFHLWDDLTNKKNFPEIINKLFRFVRNPERGLLVGSKNLETNKFSMEQFQKLKKVFLDRVENVSLFEEHNHTSSETHFHYSLDKDTWTMCSRFWQKNNPQAITVKNMQTLLEGFRNVKIAKGDQLFFNGKEVNPKDYPEIFD